MGTNSLIALYRDVQKAELALAENEEAGCHLREILKKSTAALQAACPHAAVKLTRTGTPGGYDHVSTSTDVYTCEDCREVISTFPTPGHRGGGMGEALTLLDVLTEIHKSPRRLQSNFARDHCVMVARLASCGLITTRFTSQGATFFGHSWRVTYPGLRVIELGEQE